MAMKGVVLDIKGVRDLAPELLESPGTPKIMPASYFEATTQVERCAFALKNGIYQLYTTELIEWLKENIAGRTAIEVAAGNGVLGKALGIPATDSHQQADPVIAMTYMLHMQPTVHYGSHVEKLSAIDAVRKYHPQVVVACWATHKWNPKHPEREGNQDGLDEIKLLSLCETYIFVGNREVHRNKPIWRLRHTRIEPPWLYSRAYNGSPNFIAVWNKA